MIDYRVPIEVVDSFIAEQLQVQKAEEVEGKSQAREDIIVSLASYRQFMEEDRAKQTTRQSMIATAKSGPRVA